MGNPKAPRSHTNKVPWGKTDQQKSGPTVKSGRCEELQKSECVQHPSATNIVMNGNETVCIPHLVQRGPEKLVSLQATSAKSVLIIVGRLEEMRLSFGAWGPEGRGAGRLGLDNASVFHASGSHPTSGSLNAKSLEVLACAEPSYFGGAKDF